MYIVMITVIKKKIKSQLTKKQQHILTNIEGKQLVQWHYSGKGEGLLPELTGVQNKL